MIHVANILLAGIFDIQFIDSEDFLNLVIRFLFNSAVSMILVRYIYYPITKRKDYLFTYLLFSVVIFFICFMLSGIKLSMGFALGLFALFGIIRYRTNSIEIKEMTYLFIIIGITVINALANDKVSYSELLFVNFSVIAFTYGLEKIWLTKQESQKIVTYEKIELIKPENKEEMLKDLKTRTGIDIIRFEIEQIDFLRDTARVIIFYYEKNN